jgi:predicted enzyme related to lactoylglutathione lyase
MDSVGRFVAYERETDDESRTRAFYREAFGELSSQIRIVSGPSHRWTGWITVQDVEEAAEIAVEAGGALVAGQPESGRVLVRDPHGALFGMISQGPEPAERGGLPPPGTVAWNVLVTDDPIGALPFYLRLFGWTAELYELDPLGTYLVCERDGAHTAGIITRAADALPGAHWISAIAVQSVEQSTARAVSAGAQVRYAPTYIAPIGRFSVLFDPGGVRVGLLEITATGEDIR